jgi:hypothetical protein
MRPPSGATTFQTLVHETDHFVSFAHCGNADRARVSLALLQRYTKNSERAFLESPALVTEVSDLHIATLADSQPPEVISSDRHTVRPWFQGR